ncbi:hypothetical protein BDZ89DRAFT_1066464 [Hymenopellis radicata]|nr:hypothetical protein BDZ89DRAFT_1066464 [Hymenopellis radicata]
MMDKSNPEQQETTSLSSKADNATVSVSSAPSYSSGYLVRRCIIVFILSLIHLNILFLANALLTECPEAISSNPTGPAVLLSVILQVAMLGLAAGCRYDRSGLWGAWPHLSLYSIYMVLIYGQLFLLPCATRSVWKLVVVFPLSTLVFYLTTISITGELHRTGIYGDIVEGAEQIACGVGNRILMSCLGSESGYDGQASALLGPENSLDLPSYMDSRGPARLSTTKMSHSQTISGSPPATEMV